MSVQLFRHGERTPSSKYRTDEYSDFIWPDGPGALTNVSIFMFYFILNFTNSWEKTMIYLFFRKENKACTI